MTFLQLRVIKAKQMNLAQVQRSVLRQLVAEQREIQKLLNQTTRTWKGAKPEFLGTAAVQGQNAVVKVGPAGNPEGVKKWTILDQGARRHQIRARKKRTLAFRQGGFRGKTSPGKLRSRAGSPATGPFRYPIAVNHPGIKARKWLQTAQRKRQKPFQRNVQRANNLAIRNLY